MGTLKSSRDSQPAYSTDNETHKHQALKFCLTSSYKKKTTPDIGSRNFSRMKNVQSSYLFLSSTESLGVINSLFSVVLGFSVLEKCLRACERCCLCYMCRM